MKNMRLLFVLLFTLVASFHLGKCFAAGVTTAPPTTGSSGSTPRPVAPVLEGSTTDSNAVVATADAAITTTTTGGFVDQPIASIIGVNSVTVTTTPKMQLISTVAYFVKMHLHLLPMKYIKILAVLVQL